MNICAAGNAVVFNPHPSAARCAALAVRAYNEAISPCNCEYPADGSGNSGKQLTSAEQEALTAKCDAQWPSPSKADAVAATAPAAAPLKSTRKRSSPKK